MANTGNKMVPNPNPEKKVRNDAISDVTAINA
jgi:hypothetical protein